MSITWDALEDRTFESGIDRGVLYLPDGTAVPWNGLISVAESFDRDVAAVYFDGMKIRDDVTLGSFSATLTALTYPDEFIELEGFGKLKRGIFAGDQSPKQFGLCWRTQVGNAIDGQSVGYKIHILYNVTAVPSDRTFSTLSEDSDPTEFSWEITAVPEEVPGLRPTAHFVIDSKDVDPWLLQDIEAILYGSSSAAASLIPMYDLVSYINNWFRVKIVDNGDGTWTAISMRDGFIDMPEEFLFRLIHVNAIYLNDYTFLISDTMDASDVPALRIDDNLNGTWTASTEQDGLITVNEDGTFEILNANVGFSNEDSYQISSTEI